MFCDDCWWATGGCGFVGDLRCVGVDSVTGLL